MTIWYQVTIWFCDELGSLIPHAAVSAIPPFQDPMASVSRKLTPDPGCEVPTWPALPLELAKSSPEMRILAGCNMV
jgi:hypothetical protein